MSLTQSLSRFTGWIAAWGQPEFSCGQCERVKSCAAPPSPDCLIKLEQIERAWTLDMPAPWVAPSSPRRF